MTVTTRRSALGILMGLAAGFAFGAGGTIVKTLFSEGWSPGAAVLGRLVVAAVVLAVPALVVVRFDLRPLLRAWRLVLAYAVLAVAGVQLAFYAAIERIPVSIALLVEYLAPVALLLVAWGRTRRMPHRLVLIGAALAVIGPNGAGALDPVGVALAAVAMIGVAFYYIVGDKTPDGVPPMTLAWAGFVLGAVALGLAGLIGVLPMRVGFGEVAFFGAQTPWWVPLVTVGVLSTAFAYVAGITAITMLDRARRGDRADRPPRRGPHPRRHRARATGAGRGRSGADSRTDADHRSDRRGIRPGPGSRGHGCTRARTARLMSPLG